MGKLIRFVPAIASFLFGVGIEMSGITIPWLGYSLMGLAVVLLIFPAWPWLKRIRKTRKQDKPIAIQGLRCGLEPDFEKPGFLWVVVECTLKVSNPPVQLAKLQLLMGGEKVNPVTPILPIRLLDRVETYTIRYNPSYVPVVGKGRTHKPNGTPKHERTNEYIAQLIALVAGQEVPSDEFTVPSDFADPRIVK